MKAELFTGSGYFFSFFFYSDLRKSINGLRVLSFLSTKNNPTPTRDEVGLNILLMNILLNRLSFTPQRIAKSAGQILTEGKGQILFH